MSDELTPITRKEHFYQKIIDSANGNTTENLPPATRKEMFLTDIANKATGEGEYCLTESLTITKEGNYDAPYGTKYSPIHVNLPHQSLTLTQNKIYYPNEFCEVITVDVDTGIWEASSGVISRPWSSVGWCSWEKIKTILQKVYTQSWTFWRYMVYLYITIPITSKRNISIYAPLYPTSMLGHNFCWASGCTTFSFSPTKLNDWVSVYLLYYTDTGELANGFVYVNGELTDMDISNLWCSVVVCSDHTLEDE